MHKFKVGDRFVRVYDNKQYDEAPLDCHRSGYKSTVNDVTEEGDVYDAHGCFHLADRIAPLPDTPPARRNDPATSKAAAKTKRGVRHQVYTVICGGYYEPRPQGWTGKELSDTLGIPLNSITPRFAELRRAEAIKDSGQRRAGQIVWVRVFDPHKEVL